MQRGGQAQVRVVPAVDVQGLSEAGDELLVERTGTSGEGGSAPSAWDHPHLVKIIDVKGRRRGELLAHVPGGSVAALVAARGPLPVGEAVTLLVPLADALAHLHAHGAVHGDVSPDNVLFDADGAPMLVDPGLARALGEARPRGGTDGFRAPETGHGPAADVYGWGALAWFVLTGHAAGEERHRVPLPVIRPEVKAEAGRLIEDCLAKDESLRPATADLGAALQGVHDARPLDATAAAGADGVAFLRTRTAPLGWLARTRGRVRARLGSSGLTRRVGLGLLLGLLLTAAVVWGRGLVEQAPASGDGAGSGVTPSHESARKSAGQAPAAGKSGEDADDAAQAQAVEALPELDRKRTEALANRDVEALDAIYVEGPALRADTSTIRRLRSSGTHFVSLSSRLRELEPAGRDEDGDVVVRAKATTTGKQVQLSAQPSRDGNPEEHTRAVAFTMTRTGQGWRILRVQQAG